MIVLALVPGMACASAGGARPPASPLELRALQTRSYESTSVRTAMTALLDTLQDDGFSLVQTEPELGLIVAKKEEVSRPGLVKDVLRGYLVLATYGAAALLPWQRFHHSVLEATAQVTEAEGRVKIRIALELKALNRGGHLVRSQPVTDGASYQGLFARLDKSLYLQKEGLE